MFGTLVLGIVAGVVTPYVEPHVRRILENALMAETPLTPAELRALALAICLLAAALVSRLLASGGAVSLCLGAVLGVFGPRLIERFSSRE
ncbi:MAG: hypothetical protein LJE68_17890 [Rhodobacter sp.]|nr:hypothetical protein [Rhodobacter sp.]